MTTPVLALPELTPSSIERTTINASLRILDGIWGRVPTDNILIASPPVAPVDGDLALISSGATGVFSGFDGYLALYLGGAGWHFIPPTKVGLVNTGLGLYEPDIGQVPPWIPAITNAEYVRLNELNLFTAAQVASPHVLTDASTVSIDAALSNTFYLTLDVAGSTRLITFTNLQDGQVINLHLIQDGTGGRVVTWGTEVNFGNSPAPTLSTGAGQRDIISFTTTASEVLAMPLVGGF